MKWKYFAKNFTKIGIVIQTVNVQIYDYKYGPTTCSVLCY